VQNAIIGAGRENKGAGINRETAYWDSSREDLEAALGDGAKAKLSEVQDKFRAKRANHRT
jgi:hypothetical protein